MLARSPVRRPSILAAFGLCMLGCNPSITQTPRFRVVDKELEIPEGKPTTFVPVDLYALAAAQDSGDEPGACSRGSGKNAEGACERLPVRTGRYNQQVMLPSGHVMLGNIPPEFDARALETPAVLSPAQPMRRVPVDGFWIDVVEVSRRAYEDCVRAGQCTRAKCSNGSDPAQDSGRDPAELELAPQTCVSHAQAQAYCATQNGRLPSETQWVYAARGSTHNKYPWGNQPRDDIGMHLVSVGMATDASYFGVLGLATSGMEWVEDIYDPDGYLAPFLSGQFRAENGPWWRFLADYERRFVCGDERRCRESETPLLRHVVKGQSVGGRLAMYDRPSKDPALRKPPEDWSIFADTSSVVGFRCAYDRSEEDPQLTLPEETNIPASVLRPEGVPYWLFGGVAEAVDFAEAERFCRRLSFEDRGAQLNRWRLPTLGELGYFAKYRLGPGPVWLRDGTAALGRIEKDGTDAWSETPVKPNEALMARCILDYEE